MVEGVDETLESLRSLLLKIVLVEEKIGDDVVESSEVFGSSADGEPRDVYGDEILKKRRKRGEVRIDSTREREGTQTDHVVLEVIVETRVSSCSSDHRPELVSKTKLVELVVLERDVGLRNDPLEVVRIGRVVVHDLERDEVRSRLAVVDLGRVEGLKSSHCSVTPVMGEKKKGEGGQLEDETKEGRESSNEPSHNSSVDWIVEILLVENTEHLKIQDVGSEDDHRFVVDVASKGDLRLEENEAMLLLDDEVIRETFPRICSGSSSVEMREGSRRSFWIVL